MPGCLDLAREVLGLPVQIGFPTEVDGVVDKIDDPAYATAIGLVSWGSKYEGHSYKMSTIDVRKIVVAAKGWVKNLLRRQRCWFRKYKHRCLRRRFYITYCFTSCWR